MSILYRDHRGSLDESMATCIEVKDWVELRAHLTKSWEPYALKIDEIKIHYYCFDDRIKWETYLVKVRFKGKPDFIVAGMSNGCELPEVYINPKRCLN